MLAYSVVHGNFITRSLFSLSNTAFNQETSGVSRFTFLRALLYFCEYYMFMQYSFGRLIITSKDYATIISLL
jgi:hypothetical protein